MKKCERSGEEEPTGGIVLKEWLLGVLGDVTSGVIVDMAGDVMGGSDAHLLIILLILAGIIVILTVYWLLICRRQTKALSRFEQDISGTESAATRNFKDRNKRLQHCLTGLVAAVSVFGGLFFINVIGMGVNRTVKAVHTGENSTAGNELQSDIVSSTADNEPDADRHGPDSERQKEDQDSHGTVTGTDSTESFDGTSAAFVYVNSINAAIELTDHSIRELSDRELERIFFNMPESGWADAQKVYPVVCDVLDELFDERRDEDKPAEGSAEEGELDFLTQTSDQTRKFLESLRRIDRSNYKGSRSGYKNLPDDKIVLDIIEVREAWLAEYPSVELYRLISYDYQMLGDEYVNQNGDPIKILYYYGKAILSLEEGLTFRNITYDSATGREILRYIKAVYENMEFSPQLDDSYCKSAAAIADAIDIYMKN